MSIQVKVHNVAKATKYLEKAASVVEVYLEIENGIHYRSIIFHAQMYEKT